MRILFLVPWYQTDIQPHSGTFFRDLGEGLVDKGHEVQVMYPRVGAGFRAFITGNYDFPKDKSGKVPVTYSFIPNIIPRVERLRPWLLMYKCVRDTKKLFKRWGKPDLIHAHSVYRAGFIARQLSRWYDIPYVVSENYSVVARDETGNAWSGTNFNKIFSDAEALITVSASLREDINRHYGVKEEGVKVIPNTVHALFYNSFELKSLTTPFRLHFTAFLKPVKRLDLLIEAFGILDAESIAVELQVAGDGNSRTGLERLAETLGISDRIHFLGYQTREQIKRSIDQSHAVISTSEYETFGVNLLEGLACGRPVIATDSGGPRDFIHRDNGILVEEHSPEAVAGAIRRMIDRYDSFDQERIQKEAKDKFSTDRIVSELVEVYKGVLNR